MVATANHGLLKSVAGVPTILRIAAPYTAGPAGVNAEGSYKHQRLEMESLSHVQRRLRSGLCKDDDFEVVWKIGDLNTLGRASRRLFIHDGADRVSLSQF